MKTMRRRYGFVILLLIFTALVSNQLQAAKGPVDPMDKGTWTLSFGVGPGTHFFGNGYGFGPAFKTAFETGMWKVGPGVFTLGGEFTVSYFTYKYYVNYKETWINFMFAARSAYHYGWNVEGLDTYAGVPAGIGFCAYTDSWTDAKYHNGYRGYQAVFPYFGIFLGASYYFNNVVGIYGELGYNSTYADLGVILKVK
jgi:hypothetical protein